MTRSGNEAAVRCPRARYWLRQKQTFQASPSFGPGTSMTNRLQAVGIWHGRARSGRYLALLLFFFLISA